MKKYDGTPSRRKFKGYNFYIQCNEKLSKKNREELLKTSPIYLGEVFSSLPFSTEKMIRDGLTDELDPKQTDFELLDQWNFMYDSFGYLMSRFKNQWERERIKSYKIQTYQNLERFEELVERVSKLEGEVMNLRFKSRTLVNI